MTSQTKSQTSTATITILTFIVSMFLINASLVAQTSATNNQEQVRGRRATPAATPVATPVGRQPEIGSEEWVKQQREQAEKDFQKQQAEDEKFLKDLERKSQSNSKSRAQQQRRDTSQDEYT